MIRVFSSNDKVFTSNGDVVIQPLKAKIHKEDNGSFYLDLETSLDYVDDLTANRIIENLFEWFSITKADIRKLKEELND